MVSAEKGGHLLDQYRLLGAVIDADWATRLDHKIARHVIDRYYPKYGQGRASLRYLEKATGAKRNKIIPSLRRLIDSGVFSVVRQGIGTRPTEYALNFDFVKASSGSSEGTANHSGSSEGTSSRSGTHEGTPQVPSEAPLSLSSGTPEGTESYLQDRSTDRSTESRNTDTPAAATPPPSCALARATAGAAVDPKEERDSGPEEDSKPQARPFDELWAAWSRKEKRADAKDAYAALAPDTELHATIVESAKAWAENYAALGTEKKYKKYLHNWIKGECWMEDLPVAYENAKDAAIARAREKGPKAVDDEVVEADSSSGIMADRRGIVCLDNAAPISGIND